MSRQARLPRPCQGLYGNWSRWLSRLHVPSLGTHGPAAALVLCSNVGDRPGGASQQLLVVLNVLGCGQPKKNLPRFLHMLWGERQPWEPTCQQGAPEASVSCVGGGGTTRGQAGKLVRGETLHQKHAGRMGTTRNDPFPGTCLAQCRAAWEQPDQQQALEAPVSSCGGLPGHGAYISCPLSL